VDGAFVIIAWVGGRLLLEYLHRVGVIAWEVPEWLGLGAIAVIFAGALGWAVWEERRKSAQRRRGAAGTAGTRTRRTAGTSAPPARSGHSVPASVALLTAHELSRHSKKLRGECCIGAACQPFVAAHGLGLPA